MLLNLLTMKPAWITMCWIELAPYRSRCFFR